MKALIWIVCVFVGSFIKVVLFGNAQLGAIPTVLIYGAIFAIARRLCALWDERKNGNSSTKVESNSPDEKVTYEESTVLASSNNAAFESAITEDAGNEDPIQVYEQPGPLVSDEVEDVSGEENLPSVRFCPTCGFKLLDGSTFCSKCGRKI